VGTCETILNGRETVMATPTKRRLSALFLSWEVPPFVAGGSWTATFHLVRRMAAHGVDVTVATPWSTESLHRRPFQIDIPTVGLGPPVETGDSEPVFSAPSDLSNPYSPYSPYGQNTWSSVFPYRHEERLGSWSPYDPSRSEGDELTAFADRVARLPQMERFDYVHAVDWISCAVAALVAKKTGVPWVAHLHSLEIERNPVQPSTWIERLERRALTAADLVVVPSAVTKANIGRRHGALTTDVLVMANPISISDSEVSSKGVFGSNRIVFLGRLTKQKGPDLYAAIAGEVTTRDPEVRFDVFGAGELAHSMRASGSSVNLRGPLPWENRHEAFSGASAVVVSSRNEPFGMVVLEAMASGVPVLYPHYAGVAEVISAGVQIDPRDVTSSANALLPLIRDRESWSSVVEGQTASIVGFARRCDERKLIDAVTRLT
jgi:glycosyltransferase involved in cell wall biosynthesis